MSIFTSIKNYFYQYRNTRHVAWLIWAIAALFYCYEFFLRISPTVMVPDLMVAFNVNAETLGVLSACYYYAYASMQIPVGMLLDRFGIRRLLTIAAICVAFGCFAFGTTQQLWVAQMGRILMGLGSAFAFISTVKLIRSWFLPAVIAIAIGLTNTLGVLGAVIAEAPFAKFIAAFGWRHSFILAGFLGLSLAALIFLIIRDAPKDLRKAAHIKPSTGLFWQGLLTVIKRPSNWLVAIFAGLMVAPISAFTELWSVPFLMQAHNIDRAHAALLSSIMFIGIACGGPFHGWWSGKLGTRLPALKVGAIGAMVCLLFIIYASAETVWLLMALLFLFGFFTSSMLLCFAINSENNPLNATGVAIGFTNMLVMAGGAVFQPLIGFFLDRLTGAQGAAVLMHATTVSFKMALSILPACNIVAFFLVFFIRDTKK